MTVVRRVRFRTRSGSVYEVLEDAASMRWRRLRTTRASGPLRLDAGRLLEWPDVTLGERVGLVSHPLEPGTIRIVWTTGVVEFLEHDGPAAP